MDRESKARNFIKMIVFGILAAVFSCSIYIMLQQRSTLETKACDKYSDSSTIGELPVRCLRYFELEARKDAAP